MKGFIAVLTIWLALSGSAWAAPFLVSNPETVTLGTGQTLTFSVQGLPSSIAATNLAPVSGALHLDLAGLAPGSYSVTATACLNDPTWGQECSAASVPFVFTVPVAPSVPAGLGLSAK
jgi:hypothetical protein